MIVSICGLGIMGNNHLRVCKKNNYKINSTYDPLNNDNYEKFLISLKKADALIIASPTKNHTRNILDAININPKLKILCEKPISFSSNDILLEEIKKYEKNILIGQIERFNPVVEKIKQIINSDKDSIIQIKTIRINNIPSREAIDVKKDIGIHDLDACCFLLDAVPDSINILSDNSYSNKKHENLIYKINNIQIINEISWKYPYKDRKISILSENGVYEARYFDQTLNFIDWSNSKIDIKIEKKEPLLQEILFLQKMVQDDVPSSITVSENVKLLNLLGY